MRAVEIEKKDEVPSWMSENGARAVKKRLYGNETIRESYERVANRYAEITGRYDISEELFEYMWNGWICLATPVHSNMGTDRGLPISCFKTFMDDSLTGESGIYPTVNECAEMSRVGGGVGVSIGAIRPKSSEIKGNGGKSGGLVPWMRVLDNTFDVVSQATRRGSGAVTVPIDHPDWDDFIECRDNTGDPRRRVYDLHLSTNIGDDFMKRVQDGDPEARRKWQKLIQYRWETGESYIEWYDNINKKLPKAYVDRGFKVECTNICSEILQYVDKENSVVCCLSSLNLAKYDEWKDKADRVIEVLHRLLDSVITEFLEKGKKYKYLGKALNGARKARAIGIGVLGWHDLLFQRNLAYDNSMDTMMLNAEVWRKIKEVTDRTSKVLAEEYGEPEWLKGYGERNMFKTAQAPTKSNSAVVGAFGEGVAPGVGNIYEKEGLEGSVIVENPYFIKVLDKYGKNDYNVRKSIIRAKGSVQHLDFLSGHERKVFLTAREIDQHKVVKQAAQRQNFIDQGQSLNLWFPRNAPEYYVNSVHLEAYKLGVKTLYYLKSGAAIDGDVLDMTCESCQG